MPTPAGWSTTSEVLEEVVIDRESVQTSIVVADISATGLTPDEFVARTRKEGLLVTKFERPRSASSPIAASPPRTWTGGHDRESVLPACRSGRMLHLSQEK